MFFNILGLPADAAASHRHEFSSKHDARMTAENSGYQNSYLQPLHYLHEKLLAFTGADAPESSHSEREDRPKTASSDRAETFVFDSESIASDARRPSFSKRRTIYQFAHPIHKPARKKLWRSPMLLQLRQFEASRRAPTPVLEIFMKHSTSRSVTRNSSKKSTSRRLSLKGNGYEQLVFLTCDSYEDGEGTEDPTDDEEVDRREIVASISVGSDHEAVIMVGEEEWTVSPLANGGYEFSHASDNGSVNQARWVPKRATEHRAILDVQIPLQKPSSDRQFRFVLVHSNGRRHPIVGSMDYNAIEVRDQFVMPDTPAATPDPSSPAGMGHAIEPSYHASYFNSPQLAANGVVTTSDHTRLLMLVTGVWVAVVEGWTHYGSFSNESADCLASQLSASPQRLRAPSPRPSVQQENHLETPRHFTNNISQVFSGRRHRHTITTGSIPAGNPRDAGILPTSANSMLSLVPSSISDTNGQSTVASNENVVWGDNRQPSPSPSGLGIDVCSSLAIAHPVTEEPPSSSGFHELFGKLHIGRKGDDRNSSDVSGADAQDVGRRGSKSSSKTGHSNKKSEDLGKRTRRLLGLGKRRAPARGRGVLE